MSEEIMKKGLRLQKDELELLYLIKHSENVEDVTADKLANELTLRIKKRVNKTLNKLQEKGLAKVGKAKIKTTPEGRMQLVNPEYEGVVYEIKGYYEEHV